MRIITTQCSRPPSVLRRLIDFAIDGESLKVQQITFRDTTTAPRPNVAGKERLVVSLPGREGKYPTGALGCPYTLRDYREAVVWLVARHVTDRNDDHGSIYADNRLNAFTRQHSLTAELDALERDDRAAAILREGKINAERQAKKEHAKRPDTRRAKAAAELARWQRRAKLARTKIKKLEARIRYYDRKMGAPV